MEWLIAVGLGLAAGTNAYIPLLVVGGLAKWTAAVSLPDSWSWLESEWTLAILSGLIILEFLAQRVPGLATVSDVVHTALRPTSAGIAVSAHAADSIIMPSGSQWWSEGQWIPVAVSVGVALAVHLGKLSFRVFVDSASAGVFGGLLASVDEGSSLVFSLVALTAPLLVPLVLVVALGSVWWIFRHRVRRSRGHPLPGEHS
jgi:hypothetical protein